MDCRFKTAEIASCGQSQSRWNLAPKFAVVSFMELSNSGKYSAVRPMLALLCPVCFLLVANNVSRIAAQGKGNAEPPLVFLDRMVIGVAVDVVKMPKCNCRKLRSSVPAGDVVSGFFDFSMHSRQSLAGVKRRYGSGRL